MHDSWVMRTRLYNRANAGTGSDGRVDTNSAQDIPVCILDGWNEYTMF